MESPTNKELCDSMADELDEKGYRPLVVIAIKNDADGISQDNIDVATFMDCDYCTQELLHVASLKNFRGRFSNQCESL